MNSFLYTGSVRHRRYLPRPHSFDYRVFQVYLDLDELDSFLAQSRFWSRRRFAPARFRREDFLRPKDIPLKQAVCDLVERKTGNRPAGPVRMLAHLRYFGYCFNPVTFYFCYDQSGLELETTVVEINNTPWDERHCYVLSESENRGSKDRKRFRFRKDFHVSPFMSMEIDYDWFFTVPGPSLNIQMENFEEGRKIFDATLLLRREEATKSALNRVLLSFPLITAKVIGAIYWNALLLWLKKIPFHTHPDKLDLEIRQQ